MFNSTHLDSLINADLIDEFQRNGAVCLRGVFDNEWVDKVRNGIDKNIASPSIYGERLAAPGGPGFYFNDYCNWQSIPEFRDYVLNSPAAEIAGRLMMSEKSIFYHDHVLSKDAGSYAVTPWHHDQAYYPVNGFQNCSIWMPVDHVAVENSVQFIKGSHRWGKWFYPRKFATSLNYQMKVNSQERIIEEHECESVPDIDGERDKYEILSWTVGLTDCVCFHMRMLHGAPANITNSHRRVLSTRWLGDDAVFAERPWDVSPPITGSLKPGDPFISSIFPVIWTRN